MIWLPGDEKLADFGALMAQQAIATATRPMRNKPLAAAPAGAKVTNPNRTPRAPESKPAAPAASGSTAALAAEGSRLSRFPWLPVGLGVAGVGGLGLLAAGQMNKQHTPAPVQPGGSTYS